MATWKSICVGCAAALLLAAGSSADDQLAERRAEIDRAFAAQLEKLAAKCNELKLDQQARISLAWQIDRDPRRQYLFLPDVDKTKPPRTAAEVVQFWHRKFLEMRAEHAEALFALAKETLGAHQPARAYQLLYEVLRENPDHQKARKALGYRGAPGRWRRSVNQPTAKSMRVAHPVFGWAAGAYWRIETAHFQITTNHSAKEGLEAGRRLETLYDVWRQLFFRYWSNEAALAAHLDDHAAPRRAKKHKVLLFRDRGEYVAKLADKIPGIELSDGYYDDSREEAYFYAGDKSAVANWYHEVTHQLFHETARVASGVGAKDNFWIIEGIAMYMESLAEHEGYVTVGGFDSPRLQHSRYRAFNHQFYVPLAELTAMGRDDLQKDERIRMLYSQSAGLAHLMMDYDGGRYRAALTDYLKTIYAGRERRDTLAKLVQTELENVDKQYHEYLDVTDDDVLRFLNAPSRFTKLSRVTKLSLGHTKVTDEAVARLADCTELEWLDLAFTKTSDTAVTQLGKLTKLNRLNLESTGVTDRSLQTIGGFRQLEDLDLSNTRITDDGLAELANLKNLKVLWLTGTSVTDAGLANLKGLKQLERLDTTGTSVTRQGVAELKRSLPALGSFEK